MTRIPRDFNARSSVEKKWFISETWCDHCNKADLGLVDPFEFEENGKIFIEGKCRKCGGGVVTEICE